MPAKFSRYDVVDYLKSREDVAAYLDACLEEAGHDSTFIATALADIDRTGHLTLSERDTLRVLDLLESPPPPTDRLIRAAKRE